VLDVKARLAAPRGSSKAKAVDRIVARLVSRGDLEKGDSKGTVRAVTLSPACPHSFVRLPIDGSDGAFRVTFSPVAARHETGDDAIDGFGFGAATGSGQACLDVEDSDAAVGSVHARQGVEDFLLLAGALLLRLPEEALVDEAE